MSSAALNPLAPPPLLWRRPWWTRPGPLAAVWATLLIYGSLIPFDLDPAGFIAHHGSVASAAWACLTAPAWVTYRDGRSALGLPLGVIDGLANLAIYAPLGVLLRLALARRIGRPWLQVIAAVALAAALSWTIECAQALSPSRYASLNDIAANVGSAILCAAAAVRVRSATWRRLFDLHRATARITQPALERLRHLRRGRAEMLGAVAVAACGLMLFVAMPARPSGGDAAAVSAATSAPTQATVRWPLMALLWTPYDETAWAMAGRLGVYLCLATLLAPALARATPTRSLLRLSAAAALLATGATWWCSGEVDLTEPLLAVAAAAGGLAAAFIAVHAVRRCCRRRKQAPVAHDRRRRDHDYRFAVR